MDNNVIRTVAILNNDKLKRQYAWLYHSTKFKLSTKCQLSYGPYIDLAWFNDRPQADSHQLICTTVDIHLHVLY